MENYQETKQITEVLDSLLLLSAYAHIRVLMKNIGLDIHGGVVLSIPDQEISESIIHELELCGGVRGEIHGSKIPSAFNFKFILVQCQAHLKSESVLRFLYEDGYFPVLMVCGVIPEWLKGYPNVLLLEAEHIEVEREEARAHFLHEFFEFIHSDVEDIMSCLERIKKSQQYREISEESNLYKGLYCTGSIFGYFLFKQRTELYNPNVYYNFLDAMIRESVDVNDIDLDLTSMVFKSLSKYLDRNKDIFLGDLNRIEGSLINAVKENRAILYDKDFYYVPDNLLRQATQSLTSIISFRRLKSMLYHGKVLICDGSNTNYSVKKMLTNAYGEYIRQRFLKLSRLKLEMEEQLSLEERGQAYVFGEM